IRLLRRSPLSPYTTLFRSRALPLDLLPLKAFNLVGLDALRQLLVEGSDEGTQTSASAPVELNAPRLKSLVDEIAADGHGLIMVRSEEHTSELQSRENLVFR